MMGCFALRLARKLLVVLLLATAVVVMTGCHSKGGYEVASDLEMSEFTDSSSDAIFARGEVESVHQSAELDEVFSTVLKAKSKSKVYMDIFSRNAIRRTSDGVSIRFGEARNCERALIFDDNDVICDYELYFLLSNAIEDNQ